MHQYYFRRRDFNYLNLLSYYCLGGQDNFVPLKTKKKKDSAKDGPRLIREEDEEDIETGLVWLFRLLRSFRFVSEI